MFQQTPKKEPRTHRRISERQQKAIEYLKKYKSVTAPKYAKLASISHPTAITDLNELVALGILRRTGAGRSSKYWLENIKILNENAFNSI